MPAPDVRPALMGEEEMKKLSLANIMIIKKC
ncbi:hypothetical protein KL86CLO1_11526 [uncultured Eubacteriales bacterium]|uniref:Uncharacterized protein n=1 Tax=uncultured Eubacteriales bacterium TaxID=172733 RepID=A0A212JQF4_9FIRM|nr:hypothetical protein KL86CLO1_11526 [uncultured Eubacteriales bacterium]